MGESQQPRGPSFIFGSVSARRPGKHEGPRGSGVIPTQLPSGAKRRSVDNSSSAGVEMGVVQMRGGAGGDPAPTAEANHRVNDSNNGDNNGATTEEDESRSGDSGVGSKRGEEEEDEGGVAEGEEEEEGRGGGQGTTEEEEDGVQCAGCRDHHHHQKHHRGDALFGNRGEEEGRAVSWRTCPLCRRPFEEPRVLLACLHVFCSACLRRLLLPQLCAVPDEEGVEEMEMTAEEDATPVLATPSPAAATEGTPATPAEQGPLADLDAGGGHVGSRPRVPLSELGRSESVSSSRGQPSLRSWASFKGAWSPRSGRRRPPVQAEDDHSKARDPSPRRLGLQRSLTVARTPPTSPPALRRAHGSLKASALPPLWRKRSSTASDASGGGVLLLLRCPTCATETELPTPPGTRRGALAPQAALAAVHAAVATLPLHTVLLHRMHGRKAAPRPKCDLCSLDATRRCTECSLSLCVLCSDIHRRQANTADHTLVQLQPPPGAEGGGGAPRAPSGRVPPCPQHPANAQRLFCGPCGRLACRACPCATAHRCEPVSHAARNWAAPAIRTALDKVRPYADNALTAVEDLRRAEQRVQVRASEVESEVDCFMDSWVRALEEHRRALKAEAWRARDSKLEALRGRRAALERQVEGVSTAVRFADDILAEASDAEVLGVAGALVRRLEWCRASAEASRGPRLAPLDEGPGTPVSLQFLPAERAASVNGHQMYGVVTAQAVCPSKCRIPSEGLSSCRQHRKTEVVVVTRDADDQPIGHGGEQVAADLRYRDASHRQLPVHVSDQRDGSYILTFIPDAAGMLSLAVTVQGKHIQGSPFIVHARTIRAHTGIFHCCTFCSSHGNKEVICACGGKMPGGYKGCGHGHTGHPGRRHWSCCGNVLEGSECGRSNGVFTYTI